MKINSITPNHYIKGRAMEHSPERLRERESIEHRENSVKYNNDQINTTIKNNSDGRVNFKGAEQTVEKLKEPFFHKVGKFTQSSPLLMEALFALVITCGLRPATIMATAKTDEDKEKCKYQAVKSISSGLVGLGFTAFIGNWIKYAKGAISNADYLGTPEIIKNDITNGNGKVVKDGAITLAQRGFAALKSISEKLSPEDKSLFARQTRALVEDSESHINIKSFKYFGHKGNGLYTQKSFLKELKSKLSGDKESIGLFDTITTGIKNQKLLNNYKETNQSLVEKLLQPISMPVRAAITIALVPIILTGMKKLENVLAEKKKQKELIQMPCTNQPINNYDCLINKKEIDIFGDFLKGGNNENK